ncbi:MAG: ATP-binding protein [Candidatus Krumholzibacteriia bacterium]
MIKMGIRHLAIRHKLVLALGTGAVLGFAVTGISLFVYDGLTLENRARQILEPYADLVSVGAETAIAFNGRQRAEEILNTCRSNPQIQEAAIILADGTLLAGYGRRQETTTPATPVNREIPEFVLHPDKVELRQSLPYGAQLYIVMGLQELKSRTREAMMMFALGVLALLVGVNLGLRSVLQRAIVGPVSTLAETVDRVRKTADYGRRVPVSGGDEIAMLARNFNSMMDAIGERDSELRSLTSFQGTILESAAYGIISTDPDGIVTSFNPAAERMLGYEAEEVVGKVTPLHWHDPQEIAQRAHQLSQELGQGISPGMGVFFARPCRNLDEEQEWTFIRRGGEPFPGLLSVTALRGEDGGLTGFLGLSYDLTERKQSEAEKELLRGQLAQASKMESIGRLAGGVAHDFNNMLGVIIGYAEVALATPNLDPPVLPALQKIHDAAVRSADLTRQLLAFARQQPVSPKALDLNQVVEGTTDMLRRMIGENIELVLLPGENLWWTRMDPAQVVQILTNLCINSRDAIEGAGRISIETKNESIDESYCIDHRGFVPGDFVTLVVSDNGRGMDKQTLDQIFEPFFTTKGLGQGTGLGLATVYGTVKQSQGFINVYSELGRGTTIRIYLPKCSGELGAVEPEMPVAGACGGDETILLVEDNSAIREMAMTMLERAGYQVLTAGSPGEALRIAKDKGDQVDLLVSDVVMPVMNGRELARELNAFCPRLKHLYMSGYTADIIANRGILEDGVNFIQKPFSKADLEAKVREVLDHDV